MKRLLFCLLASIFTASSMCANRLADDEEELPYTEIYIVDEYDSDKIFRTPEKWAEFPEGLEALMNFLCNEVKYPPECMENNIQGRIVVQFVVEKDGSIGDINVVKSAHPLLDQEAVRVVKMMPKWNPAVHDGEVVRSYFMLPVSFKLPTDEPSEIP